VVIRPALLGALLVPAVGLLAVVISLVVITLALLVVLVLVLVLVLTLRPLAFVPTA
jgi:hypothetical protein